MILMTKLFFFLIQIGRLPIRYAMPKYSPMEQEPNILIQRCVEHGFLRFYNSLELFYKQLTRKVADRDLQYQSTAITMDNIWIYVYIFTAANCFNFFVFLCDILVFHRKKIFRVIDKLLIANGKSFILMAVSGLYSAGMDSVRLFRQCSAKLETLELNWTQMNVECLLKSKSTEHVCCSFSST